jgi:hypothetical protein
VRVDARAYEGACDDRARHELTHARSDVREEPLRFRAMRAHVVEGDDLGKTSLGAVASGCTGNHASG